MCEWGRSNSLQEQNCLSVDALHDSYDERDNIEIWFYFFHIFYFINSNGSCRDALTLPIRDWLFHSEGGASVDRVAILRVAVFPNQNHTSDMSWVSYSHRPYPIFQCQPIWASPILNFVVKCYNLRMHWRIVTKLGMGHQHDAVKNQRSFEPAPPSVNIKYSHAYNFGLYSQESPF